MPEITWRQILPNCNRIQYFSKIWWTISRSYIYIYIYKTRLFIKPISLYICTFYLFQGTSLHQNIDEKAQHSDLPVIVWRHQFSARKYFQFNSLKKIKWYDGSPLSVGRITKIGSKYTTTLASLGFHGEKCQSV